MNSVSSAISRSPDSRASTCARLSLRSMNSNGVMERVPCTMPAHITIAHPIHRNRPMLALVKVFIDIVLWRKGPQDLPASRLLLALTVLGYFALSLTLGSALEMALADVKNRPATPLFGRTLLELALALLWIWLLLVLFRHKDRFWQS